MSSGKTVNVAQLIRISDGEKETGEQHLHFYCPGCKYLHGPAVAMAPGKDAPLWQWNGSLEKPTLSPSLLITYKYGPEQKQHTCHSFILDGNIQFLGDCTHALAGQTVPIPEWED